MGLEASLHVAGARLRSGDGARCRAGLAHRAQASCPFPPSLGWVILLCINPQRYSELQERKMNLGPGFS